MKDLEKVINGLSKSGLLSGLAGGLAGGTAASMLSGKSGKKAKKGAKKAAKKALKVGALAAVGGIAWKAYKTYSDGDRQSASAAQSRSEGGWLNQAASPHSDRQSARNPAWSTPAYDADAMTRQQFDAVTVAKDNNQGPMLLLRAMIAAANADGHIDGDERERIYQRVETMDLSVADKAALFDELRTPLTLSELVAQVPNSETAIEVYTASLLAIDLTQPMSAHYLQALSRHLFIPTELVDALHIQVAEAGARASRSSDAGLSQPVQSSNEPAANNQSQQPVVTPAG